MHLLTAQNVTKTYQQHIALENATINIPKGSIYGLLGPNGAGKTTFLRIINQITAPDSGSIYFKGELLSQKHIAHVGYLPEERGLYKKMKVGEQALYLAQIKGLDKTTALKKLKLWFEKFEMQTWWDKKIEELSKGMQQKVQFITTALHEPELLIFDEPFSGFDPINAQMLKREILELKEKGATIIFSTHDMNSVEELCDNITLINKSKCILEGELHNLKQQFKTNTFEFVYSGDINPGELDKKFEVINFTSKNGSNILTIKLPDKAPASEIITYLNEKVTLTSFREVLPDMNNIFIEAVKNAN